jgi:SAM-dependent methyltransferase
MTGRLTLPDTASIANQTEGGKLVAPSASRNLEPIAALLAKEAPSRGRALEIASGTGQHVAAFAARLPGLHWQPSDPDPARRASIDAYAAESGLSNIAAALDLDAAAPGWGARLAGQNLILLVNLLHLIPMDWVKVLIAEAAHALAPGGRFILYGPFLRDGSLTSDGDRAFHASLIAQDPRIGYKEIADILALLRAAGLSVIDLQEMPANNLAVVAERPAF